MWVEGFLVVWGDSMGKWGFLKTNFEALGGSVGGLLFG